MNPDRSPSGDALIDEVRERRTKLLASVGDDLARLVKAVRELEHEHPELVVPPPDRSRPAKSA